VNTGTGTRVLVTGAASGLGRAIAAHCAAAGCRVLVTDLCEPAAPPAGEVSRHRLDVRSDEEWAAVRDWCEGHGDGLDVPVNNAGVAAAVAGRRFPALTHPEGRRAARTRRLWPSLVDRRTARVWRRIRAKLEEQDAAGATRDPARGTAHGTQQHHDTQEHTA
jgi:NAD(P)-dependent dehydrogenase (short-subunit alcohol dehydrogenase family)